MNDLNGFLIVGIILVVAIIFGSKCNEKPKPVQTPITHHITTEKVGEVVGGYSTKFSRGFIKGIKEETK